jgi:hypothetical protein
VCGNAITRFKVDELRHILIAIAGVKEFVTRASLGKDRRVAMGSVGSHAE